MSQNNIAFLNLFVDGSLPTVFNPSTFRSSSIQSDQIATQSLTVTSQTNTNGIVDYNTIEAQKLSVNSEANYNGSLVPNSSCLATTYYVDNKINTIMGGSNLNTLLDSISEINQALNNDPNYANTVGLRIGQVEVNTQNNTNSIGQINNAITDINESLVSIDTRLNNDRSDITDLESGLTLSNQQITTNTSNIGTNTTNISSNTSEINSLKTRTTTNETNIANNTTNITNNTNSITTNTNNISSNTSEINSLKTRTTTNENNIASNTSSIGTINTTLATKANSNNPTFTGTAIFNTITTQALTDNGNITIKGNTVIGDQSTDTLTVTGNAKFNHNLVLSDNTNALTRLNNIDTSITNINSSLSTKANDNQVVHISGNETLNGVKTFNDVPKIGLSSIATTNDISTAINNLINSAPSTLDTLGEIATQLQTNGSSIETILSSMTTLSGNQTITGIKTFTTSPIVPTLTQGNNSTNAASTSYVDTGLTNIQNNYLSNTTASSTYQTLAGMTSYLTTSNASSTYQPLSGMTSYLTTSNASSTYQPLLSGMSSYLTTSNASSIYQTISGMSSYLSNSLFSNSNTFTGTNEYQNDLITNKLCEKYVAGTVTTNAMSINYSSNTNNIYTITPSSANNITLTITNIPTNRGTAIYNFTFIINTSTNKNFINVLNVNGNAITMRAIGGLANVSINTSAVLVIQTLNIVMNGSTVSNAITSVASSF